MSDSSRPMAEVIQAPNNPHFATVVRGPDKISYLAVIDRTPVLPIDLAYRFAAMLNQPEAALTRDEGITEEPPIGTRVRDRIGIVWDRQEDGWRALSSAPAAPWDDLVEYQGPLETAPVNQR